LVNSQRRFASFPAFMISTPERSNGLTTSNRIANPNVPNRRFQFQKRSQLFIRSHNEPLPRRRDRARIVFDCRMVNDPANISSTISARV
jgi:hypothetical protein